MKNLLLSGLALLSGCYYDLVDRKKVNIKNDVYALHAAGIAGYSIAKKLGTSGYRPIIDACVVTVNYDDDFKSLVVKRIEEINSTDTLYLLYSFESGKLDTINRDRFYELRSRYKSEIILLPPK